MSPGRSTRRRDTDTDLAGSARYSRGLLPLGAPTRSEVERAGPSLQSMPMDVIEAHAARLPSTGGRWIPRPHARADLIAALLEARIAGEVTHPLDNVHRHIAQLCEGDPDKQFGMTGLADAFSPWEVPGLVAAASGLTPDPDARSGPV